jgi:hypothetical protein
MLQWLYTYVVSVYFKCSSYFQKYVASALSDCCICCGGHTYMLQAYVSNVSDVYCKCFIEMSNLLSSPDEVLDREKIRSYSRLR